MQAYWKLNLQAVASQQQDKIVKVYTDNKTCPSIYIDNFKVSHGSQENSYL